MPKRFAGEVSGTDSCAYNTNMKERTEDTMTFEEVMEENLDEARQALNDKEAAFARLPAAVRRMTRVQARAVGWYF